jgi:hypothetical protein
MVFFRQWHKFVNLKKERDPRVSYPIKQPSVSVIILNYNGETYVKRCLTSIFSNVYSNFEFIFVDNAKDRGLNWLRICLVLILALGLLRARNSFSDNFWSFLGFHITIKKRHLSAYPSYHFNGGLRERKLASYDIALFKQPAKCEKRIMG